MGGWWWGRGVERKNKEAPPTTNPPNYLSHLLKERNQHRHRQLGPVRPLKQHATAPGFSFDCALRRRRNLRHLLLHVGAIAAARPGQHFDCVFWEAAQVEGGGGVGQEEGAEEEGERGDSHQTERHAPPVGQRGAQDAVVDELGAQDAEGGGELEQDVDGALVWSGWGCGKGVS